LTAGLRQGLAILLASCAVGFGVNAMRPEPLPMRGSLDPPPEPESGSGLAAISAADARARWEGGSVFVDVRTRAEWVGGRIAGAVSADASSFPQSYFDITPPLDPAIPLVVYGAGADSFAVRRVAGELVEMGHGDVALAVCGMAALAAFGVPTEGEPIP
jgi:rhodanese-related sulfurtransferase